MWDLYDGFGWWVVFGGIWSLLFWVAMILLVVWAVKKIMERPEKDRQKEKEDAALKILKERYAKGEISKEEYTQIKEDISK